jgi:hypothetical protein
LLTIVLFGGLRYFISLTLIENVYAIGYTSVLTWTFSDTDIPAVLLAATTGTLILAGCIWVLNRLARNRLLPVTRTRFVAFGDTK